MVTELHNNFAFLHLQELVVHFLVQLHFWKSSPPNAKLWLRLYRRLLIRSTKRIELRIIQSSIYRVLLTIDNFGLLDAYWIEKRSLL